MITVRFPPRTVIAPDNRVLPSRAILSADRYTLLLPSWLIAAVIAAGMANIAKIRSTQVSKNAGASASTDASVPAAVSAPAQDYTPPEQLRTVTSASEEQRLNRMADSQRVYIVQSDIEAAGRAQRVRVAESTF